MIAQRMAQAQNLAPLLAAVAVLLLVTAAAADPLHKVGSAGAYQHEQSGWIFAKQTGEFARIGAPYTIDGNDDVGAEYERIANGSRATASVDIYAADSAAFEAKLDGAKAAIERNTRLATGFHLESEEPFSIGAEPQLTGVAVTYASDAADDRPQARLYFFDTGAWIVTIRATTDVTEEVAGAALDRFVREQRWDTLGVAPGDLH